jgi:hypothetical protein
VTDPALEVPVLEVPVLEIRGTAVGAGLVPGVGA